MIRVILTPEAEGQVSREIQWWYEHRPKNPFLFEDELNAAIDVLTCSTKAGLTFALRPQVRRYLLSGSRYHVYYRYDPVTDELRIVSVWSAIRRRGPPARFLR
jgi:plasmid stabilization system protein ParE